MEIMNKNLTIAFDIEGTLLNNKGKLDPDVLPIFEKADFKNTNFIFLTGGNISLADYAIEQIKNAVPEFKSSRFWVASNGGSHVRGPSGISKIETFNTVRLGRFISNARAYDNDCFLIYVTEKGNFIDIPASHFAKTAFWFYNKKDKSKGNAALNLQPIEGLKQGYRKDRGVSKKIPVTILSTVEEIRRNRRHITKREIYEQLCELGELRKADVSESTFYRFLSLNEEALKVSRNRMQSI